MSKQEEIREGIAKYIRLHYDASTASSEITASVLMKYLDEQGVVIEVNRELPEYVIGINTTSESSKMLAEEVQRDMLEAGYVVVESLVEDDKL